MLKRILWSRSYKELWPLPERVSAEWIDVLGEPKQMLPKGGANVSSWCQLTKEGRRQHIFYFCQNAVFPFGWRVQSICLFVCLFLLIKTQIQILNYLSWNSGSIHWPFDLSKLLDSTQACFLICKMRTIVGLPLQSCYED